MPCETKLNLLWNFTRCDKCNGKRLRPEILAVRIQDKDIFEFTQCRLQVPMHLSSMELSATNAHIAEPIVREIGARLKFLCDVGLEYLSLSRSAGTFSGGEAQRIRLATRLPIGALWCYMCLMSRQLDPIRGIMRSYSLLLRGLCDMGNTLIVVEHDEDTIKSADFIVDIGPKAGKNGGEVVFAGTYKQLLKSKKSITARYINGLERITYNHDRRVGNGAFIEIIGASQNNLKNIDVKFPLGTFIAITGVSGSGKSSLINEILYKSLASKIYKSKAKPGKHKEIRGINT